MHLPLRQRNGVAPRILRRVRHRVPAAPDRRFFLGAYGDRAGRRAALSLAVEYAPRNRRALWGSVVSAAAAVGTLAGALVALALSTWLTEAQMQSWGWRLPFLIAAPLGVIGLYVRLRLEDTPVFRELQASDEVAERPLREAGTRNRRQIGLVMAVASLAGLGSRGSAATPRRRDAATETVGAPVRPRATVR